MNEAYYPHYKMWHHIEITLNGHFRTLFLIYQNMYIQSHSNPPASFVSILLIAKEVWYLARMRTPADALNPHP